MLLNTLESVYCQWCHILRNTAAVVFLEIKIVFLVCVPKVNRESVMTSIPNAAYHYTILSLETSTSFTFELSFWDKQYNMLYMCIRFFFYNEDFGSKGKLHQHLSL